MITDELRVGDCLILNECEKPSAPMIVVVTDADRRYCQYLNADKEYDSFNKKPYMRVDLAEASRVSDYGVTLEILEHIEGSWYCCEKVAESNAKYGDGEIRKWQGQAYRYEYRPELMELVKNRAEHFLKPALPPSAEPLTTAEEK